MQVAFGSGLLFATPLVDAFGAAIANPTPFLLGVMQDCAIDLSFDTKELHGQNNFPVDIGRGKGKLSGKTKAAQINAKMFNSLFFGQTMSTGLTSIVYDTTGTAIPSTPFTITPTPPASGVWAADLGVRNASGVPLTRVASGPATGQYSVASGVYTFAAADTGNTVYINYRYTVASAGSGNSLNVINLPMGEIPSFQAELLLKKGGKSTYVRVPNFVTSKFNFGTKQDDFLIPEFDFSGFADPSGNVIYWSTTE